LEVRKVDKDEDSWPQSYNQLVCDVFNFLDGGKISQKEAAALLRIPGNKLMK